MSAFHTTQPDSTQEMLSDLFGTRSVAENILEQLRLWGVKRIYGVVGDAIFTLMDALARQNAIQFISVKHESVAALMASAEAKCTGKLGVCVSQMGPGLANLINGLGDAFLDGAPVLAITGQAPLKQIGTMYKQYVNQQQLVQSVSGYSELVVHPDAVIESLSRAIHTSMTTKTVSHLSVPADVFAQHTLTRPFTPIRATPGIPEPETIQQAILTMKSARRPMILVGNKASLAGELVQQLSTAWGSVIGLGYGTVGAVPDAFPYQLGVLGEGGNPHLIALFKEADVVLVIGNPSWPEGYTPNDLRVIMVADQSMSLGVGIPIDCGIVGEPARIVSQLVEGLKGYSTNPDWVEQIRVSKQTWSRQNEWEGNEPGFPLHPSRIVRAIEKVAAPDAVIALDEGDSTLWFMHNFRAERQQVLLSNLWRTMGFGLPAAMAAKCCLPEKQVFCVIGDGGLAMVLADLLTAARYRLPITAILLNNGALQMERNKMMAKGLLPKGTEITNPDFARLAEACGWEAYRVESADDLEYRLQTSLSGSKPVLLDVPTAQVPYPNYSNL